MSGLHVPGADIDDHGLTLRASVSSLYSQEQVDRVRERAGAAHLAVWTVCVLGPVWLIGTTREPSLAVLCAVGLPLAVAGSVGIAMVTLLLTAATRPVPAIRVSRETLRVGAREWPLSRVQQALPQDDHIRVEFVDGSAREIAHRRPMDTRYALARVIRELARRARQTPDDPRDERRLRALRGRASG